MDPTSDSDNEEILEFCKKLKIKVPLEKKKKKNRSKEMYPGVRKYRHK